MSITTKEPGFLMPEVDYQVRKGGKPRIKVNTELRFYYEVLGLEYLHYGLWDGEPLTVEGLKAAQDRYAAMLCDWIPEDVKSVLDIGCGTGQNALKLKSRGFEVEGLSPDPYQGDVFRKRTGLPFHLSRLQEHEPSRTFDLAIMSESAQYIHLDTLFPSTARVVPGGYLLVCDYFWRSDGETNASPSGHRLDEFLAEAERNDFDLQRREDITDRVAPTLDLARAWVDRYALPTAQILIDHWASRRPRLFKLGRRLVAKQALKLARLQEKLDSQAFRKAKTYQIILFRQSRPATR